jgi:hypothetical protein
MSTHEIDGLIQRLESYLDYWKQYNQFLTLARARKFSPEEENEFLEIKCVLTQELEILLASMECGSFTRDEVHNLMVASPSMRFLAEQNDAVLRNLENQWHKLFIGLQSVLGQLKVRQQQNETQSRWGSWFGRKAA